MTALRPYHPRHVIRPDLGEIHESDRIVEMELRAIRERRS
jgi:hypothetical protein